MTEQPERQWTTAELLQLAVDEAAARKAIRGLIERVDHARTNLAASLCRAEDAENFAWRTLRERAAERPGEVRALSADFLANADGANARVTALENEVRAVLAGIEGGPTP